TTLKIHWKIKSTRLGMTSLKIPSNIKSTVIPSDSEPRIARRRGERDPEKVSSLHAAIRRSLDAELGLCSLHGSERKLPEGMLASRRLPVRSPDVPMSRSSDHPILKWVEQAFMPGVPGKPAVGCWGGGLR